jgi:hypothetical protein
MATSGDFELAIDTSILVSSEESFWTLAMELSGDHKKLKIDEGFPPSNSNVKLKATPQARNFAENQTRDYMALKLLTQELRESIVLKDANSIE